VLYGRVAGSQSTSTARRRLRFAFPRANQIGNRRMVVQSRRSASTNDSMSMSVRSSVPSRSTQIGTSFGSTPDILRCASPASDIRRIAPTFATAMADQTCDGSPKHSQQLSLVAADLPAPLTEQHSILVSPIEIKPDNPITRQAFDSLPS
jgi:hypothetical protein